MGLFDTQQLDTPFPLNSWNGDQGMRPCFASIKIGKEKVTDQQMYDQLRDARSDRDSKMIMQIQRDAVSVLRHALGETSPEPVDVVIEEPKSDF